jgi:hypothetical protein
VSHLRLVTPRQVRVPSPREQAALRRRADIRWDTPLGRFVDRVTVLGVVQQLRAQGVLVTPHAIYQWLSGRTRPKFEHAVALVHASQHTLGFEDIWQHRTFLTTSGPEPEPYRAAA